MNSIFIGIILTAALCFIIYLAHAIIAKKPNKTSDVEEMHKTKKAEQRIQRMLVADELEMYKDCLEQGVITQEEFDAKKKQLLGL